MSASEALGGWGTGGSGSLPEGRPQTPLQLLPQEAADSGVMKAAGWRGPAPAGAGAGLCLSLSLSVSVSLSDSDFVFLHT